ncbi:MAG: hypothetical protein AVDCRST_MAG42-3107 [uncultured Chthoniobacterales bacterium]|uniref:DUF4331 domain-containing protein n=1 Tax=uncultured Chthoniobacterales bacterium TaxID=1836801 RepID=A0A6J4J6F4_9BACT|nr:MAG: hypothetical protein AVDCRST_MAG42-3107 [uncultured Chthoniobacterales bacterium]
MHSRVTLSKRKRPKAFYAATSGQFRRVTAVALAVAAALTHPVRASDHQDTPQAEIYQRLDISDVYAFPGSSEDRIALVMTTHALLTSAETPAARFDATALYEFKIDNTGDHVADLVIQFSFENLQGGGQRVALRGPGAPVKTGRQSALIKESPDIVANINTVATIGAGATQVALFAGPRDDPAYLDLDQSFRIQPDRRPSRGPLAAIGPAPEANAFRAKCTNGVFNAGQAQFDQTRGCAADYLRTFNTMAIVIELPESAVTGGATNIRMWATTSLPGERPGTFDQFDRAANPWISNFFLEKREHEHFNNSTPNEDVARFRPAIARFVAASAGRDLAYANSVASTVTPDVLLVRTDKVGGGPFGPNVGWLTYVFDPANGYGGRKLQGDDVIDKMLSIVFGNAFGNNNNVSPGLVRDNVDADEKADSATFPYIATPN